MSGLVGHTTYALLARQEAERRKLPIVSSLRDQEASYLAGAYIGCDIQVMPEAVCVDTGREVGFGTVPLSKSPLTGGEVKPWSLAHEGRTYRPMDIHAMFYGRAHLVFGWPKENAALAVPWDHLADYCALAMQDSPLESHAYLFGWIVHIVGDSLIKSIRPGIRLQLLDGTYTPRNRPIQDLFAFHEIGIKELRIDWPHLFEQMAASSVKDAQRHYMRIGERTGKLGEVFADGWQPQQTSLLNAVMHENRRWLGHHAKDVLSDMALNNGKVSAAVQKAVGDLDYPQMMAMAEHSQLRETLRIISSTSVDLFEQVLKHR